MSVEYKTNYIKCTNVCKDIIIIKINLLFYMNCTINCLKHLNTNFN